MSFVDPPSGSVIADFEGTQNASTLTCNISDDQGLQILTQWTLLNYDGSGSLLRSITIAAEYFSVSGDPTGHPIIPTYHNHLVVLRLATELDGVLVYCGGYDQFQQANFTLRIYRKFNKPFLTLDVGYLISIVIVMTSRLLYNCAILDPHCL